MLTAKDRLNHCSLVMQDVNQYPLDVPSMKKLRTYFLPGLNRTGQLLLTKIIFCVELRPFLYLGQYRIILSADAASEKYKLLSKKRR